MINKDVLELGLRFDESKKKFQKVRVICLILNTMIRRVISIDLSM